MNVSINEIEFSVRVANIMNILSIKTITELVERCVVGRKFVGLKGRQIGQVSNYEIAYKLHELGFLDSMDGIRVPMAMLPPPTFCKLLEIEKVAKVDFDTKLVDMKWQREELRFLNNYSSERGSTSFLNGSSKISNFILQFLRVDNHGNLVLRKWGYQCREKDLDFGLNLVRQKLFEWGVPYSEYK